MRVGLGTTMIEPGLNGGRLDGIGVYTQALLEQLPAQGCAVQAYSWPRARGRQPGDITVGRPFKRTFEHATAMDTLFPGFLHRTKVDADIFHVTDYRVVRMNCPVVATLHDALPIKYPEWCNPNARRLKNWLQVKAAKKAQHIIAPSHFAIPELVECFGVQEKNISVVLQGVDEVWFEPPPAKDMLFTQRVHRLQPGYFLFVGTLQPRKNIDRVIDAYLALPKRVREERQLVIVGAPGWRSEQTIERIAALRKKRERILWLDKLTSQEQLRHVYHGAGVFVFPSLYEGFGIPVIEAFAAGVPVVASSASALPEVSQGAALEPDPLSVPDISEAMLSLVDDEFLRRRCIDAGRARAQQLTWRSTARKTAAVYHAVLSR